MKQRIIDPRTQVPVIMRRPGNVGQLDDEFEYGPRVLDDKDIPIDLRERFIRPTGMLGRPGGEGGALDFSGLISDVHSIAGVSVLRRGLLGRVVSILPTPVLIINATEPRGYLLLNPAGVVGLTAKGTVFSTTTLVGATTLTSGDLAVANFKTGRFFLEATLGAGVGPVTFDLQTLNPATGNFITAQTIFTVAATPFTGYADVGTLGIYTDAQILVTVPGGTTITFTMGFVLKDGLAGTSAGVTQTIFIGGPGVSSVSGYPLLAGIDKSFYLMENVNLYAVTAGPTLNMNIFEL